MKNASFTIQMHVTGNKQHSEHAKQTCPGHNDASQENNNPQQGLTMHNTPNQENTIIINVSTHALYLPIGAFGGSGSQRGGGPAITERDRGHVNGRQQTATVCANRRL